MDLQAETAIVRTVNGVVIVSNRPKNNCKQEMEGEKMTSQYECLPESGGIGQFGRQLPPSYLVETRKGKMTDSDDKRSEKRIACKIPIPVHVSFFHSKQSIQAQLVDHCINGICFLSDTAFFQGTAIIFRVAYCRVDASSSRDLETLPSVRLGEVKWCRKLPAESSNTYGVGVKYYPQVY